MASLKNSTKHIYEVIGAGKVAQQNKRVAMSMNQVARASGRMGRSFAQVGRMFGGQALGLISLGFALRKVVRDYAEYDNSVARIRSTLASTIPNYQDAARKATALSEIMSRKMAYSVTESNDAMNTLLQTGIGTHKSMRIFETGLKLARVAGMDTSDAMQFLVDSMNMFEKEQLKTGETVQQFSRRMASQLSVAANMAATSMGQLQQAFKYAGGELGNFGYSSQDVVIGLASMSAGGVRASSAGTRLRAAIAALHTPSDKVIKLFGKYGVKGEELENTFYNTTTGGIRPMAEGIDRLGKLFSKITTDADKNQAIIRLFGRRALIAGMSLTGMGKIASTAKRIREQFESATGSRDISEGLVLDRQNEAMMESFGIQVQQTKEAINELAIGFGEILFGSLKKNNEGFGTQLRNLAGHMRLARLGNKMTKEQKDEWDALTQQQRDSATELKDTMQTITDFTKTLGKLILWLGRGTKELSDNGISVGDVIRLYLSYKLAIFALRGPLSGLIGSLGGGTRAFGAMTTGAKLGLVAVKGFGLFMLAEAANALADFSLKLFTTNGEMKELNKNTVIGKLKWVKWIPIIGQVADSVGKLIGMMQRVYQINEEISDRREKSKELAFASGEDIMSAERRRRYSQGQSFDIDEKKSFIRGEKSRAIGRMSAIFSRDLSRHDVSTRGNKIKENIRTRLRGAGVTGTDRIHSMSEQIFSNLSKNLGEYHQQSRELGITEENTAEKTNLLARQIGGLNTALSNAIRTNASIVASIAGEGETAAADDFFAPVSGNMTVMRDGYVRRGGVAGVSTGDVVVSRSHLADAVTGSRGSMVPAITGSSQSNIQPPGGAPVQGTSIQADVPIILQLDGSEIARAIGKVHLRHTERSGTTIQPGQRRSLTESGFSESRR